MGELLSARMEQAVESVAGGGSERFLLMRSKSFDHLSSLPRKDGEDEDPDPEVKKLRAGLSSAI